MTVRRLLYEMDSRELSEWFAYDCIDGIDDPHSLERHGPMKQSGQQQASILSAFAKGLA